MRPNLRAISLLSLASLTVAALAASALAREPVRQSASSPVGNSLGQSATVSGSSLYANARGCSIDFEGGSALAYLDVVRNATQFAGIVAVDEHLLEEIVLPAVHLRDVDVRTSVSVLTAVLLPTRSGDRVRVMSSWVGPAERIAPPMHFTTADDDAIRRGACVVTAELIVPATAVSRTLSVPAPTVDAAPATVSRQKADVPPPFTDAELAAMPKDTAKELLSRIAAARQVGGFDAPTAERLKNDFQRVLQKLKQ
jgi:hypothetical protein